MKKNKNSIAIVKISCYNGIGIAYRYVIIYFGEVIFMYCKNCGTMLNDNQEFCANCGVKVGGGGRFCQNCGGSSCPALTFARSAALP